MFLYRHRRSPPGVRSRAAGSPDGRRVTDGTVLRQDQPAPDGRLQHAEATPRGPTVRPGSIWRDWRTWAVLAVFLIPLGPLETAHRFTASFVIQEPVPWERVLARDVVVWLSYLLFLPAVLLLANRLRLDCLRNWRRNGIVHLAAAVIFAYLHLIIVSIVTSQTGLAWESLRSVVGVPDAVVGGFADELVYYVWNNFTLSFLSYWVILGVYYASYYYAESREGELRAARLEDSLAAARLHALRSQLNPHFLFNSLNTISVLAMKGQQTAVVDMLARVGELLRYSLDDTRPQEIPLAEELDLLDRYLGIQEIRFGDRLAIRREIAPETLPALVPSMILQPIVENALKHGVSEQAQRACIAIHASRRNGSLCLQVRDSGPGFQPRERDGQARGIGLANTRNRLKQLYGSVQRIEYGQSPDGGATVTISIPFRGFNGEPSTDGVREEHL
jgi:two-component sensor histidine kinase